MRILDHPNPVLKQKAYVVDPASDRELVRLANEMARLMYEAPGIGLAAPQVGVQKRLIVFDLGDDRQPQALCNPVILERSDETLVDDEGCLSLPGISVPVERHATVVCGGQDLGGRTVRIEADELFARMLQHEIDHLDGVLILDRATPEERKAAMRRYREALEGTCAEKA
jgi:peptide deformylase